jgi:outer membrane protein assembly factor BamB
MVRWQKITPDGRLLVASGTEVTLLDPETGNKVWTQDVGNLVDEYVTFIPNSTFIEFASDWRDYQPQVAEKKEKKEKKKKKKFGAFGNIGGAALSNIGNQALGGSGVSFGGSGNNAPSGAEDVRYEVCELKVLDMRTGKIIIDEDKNIEYQVLQRSGNPLVYGFFEDPEKPGISLIDIKTGERLWTTNSIFKPKKKGFKIAGIELNFEYNPNALTATPLDLSDNTLLLALKSGIFKLDIKTGKTVWHSPLPKLTSYSSSSGVDPNDDPNIKLVLSPVEDDVFYYIDSFRVMAMSSKDGSELWDKAFMISNAVDKIIYTPKGMIMAPVAGSGATLQKANMYYIDYKTGKSLWPKKSMKVKGGVASYQFVDGGKILLQMEDTNGSNSLSVVDVEAGKRVFKKAKKVRGQLHYVEQVDKGYLYITSSELNVLDKSGKKLLTSKLGGEDVISRASGDDIYFYDTEKRTLRKLNKHTLEVAELGKVKKAKGKEDYNAIEITDSEIILTSLRNVARYSKWGELISHNYYSRPGLTGFGKFLAVSIVAMSGPGAILVYGPGVASHVITGDFHSSEFANKFDAVAQQRANNSRELYFMDDPIYQAILKRLKSKDANLYKTVLVDFEKYKDTAKNVVDTVTESKFEKTIKTVNHGAIAVINTLSGEIELLINAGDKDDPNYAWDAIEGHVYYNMPRNVVSAYAF